MGDKGNTMPLDSVYVSYSWKVEEQNLVVDKLEQVCLKRGIELQRDKKRIGYSDSIRAYMDELAAGRYVVLVLSKPYFESDYCMYELREIYNNKGFHKRVYPIVISGTHFHKPVDRVPYIRHWENEKAKLEKELATVGREYTKRLNAELDNYADFRRLMDELLSILADMNTLTEDVHVGTDFEALLDRIKLVIAPPGDKPDPPGHEKQKAFENKIRGEIKKLLSKENLKSFAGVLLEVLRSKDWEPNEIAPKDVRSGRDPPDVEELVKKLWMPDDPLEMIDRLHKATSRYLKVLGESGNVVSEEHIVWKAAVRILGYVVICLVSREWLASPQAKRNPYYNIPVERLGSIEIVSARLAEIPASLALSGSMIHGAYCINTRPDDLRFPHTYHPESGWEVAPTVGEIEKMVFKVVFPDRDVRRELTNVDRDELNDTLKINREDENDTKNYYLAIDKNSASHPLCNHEICIALDGVLNELPIIHFGRGAESQLPLNKEGVVHSRIGRLLQLINQYQ